MSKQLRLLETSSAVWRLDNDTKRVGREGIAAARAALSASRRRYPSPQQRAA